MMIKDKIVSEIEQIRELVLGVDGIPGELEKDIILEKLRGIYNEVKFCSPAPCGNVLIDSGKEVPVEQETLIDLTEEAQTSVPLQAAVNIGAVEGVVPEAETRQPAVVTTDAEHEQEPEASAENTEQARVPEPAINAPVQPTVAPSNEMVNESAGDELPAAKPKIDRKAFLSLYGDDPAHVTVRPEPEVEEESANGFATSGNTEELPDIYEPVSDIPEKQAAVNEQAAGKTVLGDVLNAGEQTIADAYASQMNSTDVATKLSSGNVELRRSIGLNDKFLMIGDIFDGNADAYEEAISDLDRFDDLDEVLLHIHDTYQWNPNSEGVKLLIELLTRKLS